MKTMHIESRFFPWRGGGGDKEIICPKTRDSELPPSPSDECSFGIEILDCLSPGKKSLELIAVVGP